MISITNHSEPEAVLQGLLYTLSNGVYRTKLVKLVYLLDETNYRLRGRTMTGFGYEWSHYGPNAVGNAIVSTLDGLVKAGTITMENEATPNGTAYRYQIAPSFDPTKLSLSADEWAEIRSVNYRYGKMNRDKIVQESKATAPMQKVGSQYESLKFEQDPLLTQEEIDADPLWKETVDALNNPGEVVDIEEVRRMLA
jgi:hypothetical protein